VIVVYDDLDGAKFAGTGLDKNARHCIDYVIKSEPARKRQVSYDPLMVGWLVVLVGVGWFVCWLVGWLVGASVDVSAVISLCVLRATR
jgi:hypothetical protein